MSPNERDLFKRIAQAVNPDWRLTLRDWQPGGAMPMADLRVFVYAVDTSNGWVTGAATTRAELERQAAVLAALPADEKRAILGGAGSIVIDASDAGTDGSSQLAEHAVKAAMMAITLSQTYASALAARLSPAWKDQDDHFAYLIYRGLGGRADRAADLGGPGRAGLSLHRDAAGVGEARRGA